MRISITDRCNLRCRYCMPDGAEWIPMKEILTYEEITEVCQEAVKLGITRFKITGGEPLVRRGCPEVIRMIKNIPGTELVTLTTNGLLLGEQLEALLSAGLDAVNISLDTLDIKKYEWITGFDKLAVVLSSIEKAVASGIPVKINAVLQKGMNEEEWLPLTELARKYISAPIRTDSIRTDPRYRYTACDNRQACAHAGNRRSHGYGQSAPWSHAACDWNTCVPWLGSGPRGTSGARRSLPCRNRRLPRLPKAHGSSRRQWSRRGVRLRTIPAPTAAGLRKCWSTR